MLALDEGIDGSLLWILVEDFNEFSILFKNAGERLRLKQFVLTNPVPKEPPKASFYESSNQEDAYVSLKMLFKYNTIVYKLFVMLSVHLFIDTKEKGT